MTESQLMQTYLMVFQAFIALQCLFVWVASLGLVTILCVIPPTVE